MKPASLTRSALAAATALVGAGCVDMEQKLTLNPDGSGKVTMTVAMAVPDLGGLGGLGGLQDAGGKKDPKAEARELVVTLLRSEGFEAWSDVTYGVGKDGRTRASATGYFPDATKVKLAKPMDDKGGNEDLGVSKNKDGNWVVEHSLEAPKEPGQADSPDTPADPPKALSDSEVEEKLIAERQQWAAMKGFMGAFFEGLRIAHTLEGGGTIVETSLFEKKADNRASFEFSGKKILATIDEIMMDDEKAKALIKKGVSPSSGGGGPGEFLQSAFGGDGKLRVVMKPGDPAFDYKAEVAKARGSQSPELTALLADAKKPARKKNTLQLDLPGQNAPGDEPPGAKPGKPAKPKQPAKID